MAVCTSVASPASQTKPEARASSRILTDVGEMTLCVRCRGHKDRLVRIRSPKCTIGSAAGCTLRLRAKGVGPLHCWVLRGTTAAIVRRFHGATSLNGHTFDESALRPGDRLQFGSVEVELVELNQPAPDASSIVLPPRPTPPASLELEEKLAAANERLLRLEEQARQGIQSSIVAAERAEQLSDALKAAHKQLEQSSREVTEAKGTIALQTAELADYQRRLEAAQSSHSGVTAEREETRQALAAAARQRDALQAELTSARASLEQATDAWHTERAQLQHRLDQRDAELKAIRATSTAQTGVMTVGINELQSAPDQSSELIAKCADLEKQLGEAKAALETKQAEVEKKKAELEAKQTEIETKKAEFERTQAEVESTKTELQTTQAALDAKQAEAEFKQTEIVSLQGELESLRQNSDGRAAIEDRLNKLSQEYDQKCRELDDAKAIITAADQLRSQASSEHDEESSALTRWQEELAQREEKLTMIRDQLAHELKAAANEKDQWSARRQQLENDHENVANLRRQLETDRREFLAERNRLAEEERQLAADRQELMAQQSGNGALAGRDANLQQHADELERQIAVANERLRDVEALRDQLTAERSTLAEQAATLEQRAREVLVREQALEQKLNELAAAGSVPNQAMLAAARSEDAEAGAGEQAGLAANVTARWQSHEDLAAEEQASAAADDSSAGVGQTMVFAQGGEEPNNVDSVIGRLVRSGLWREGEGPPSEPEAAEPQVSSEEQPLPPSTDDSAAISEAAVNESSAVGPVQPHGHASGEEESIESYMERLMHRVRGSTSLSQSTSKPPSAVLSNSTPMPAPEPAKEPEQAGPPEDNPSSTQVRRRAAPELPTDLSAMRELANTAARTAIDSHARKRKGKQATTKLFGATATIILSAVLGYWAWRLQSFDAAGAAAIGGLVGLYWCLSAVGRLFGLRRERTAEEPEAPPADKK
jgi:hypothetical protein